MRYRLLAFSVSLAVPLIAALCGALGSVAGGELLLLAAGLTGWSLRTPQSAAYLFCGSMAIGALVSGWLLVSRANLPETLAGRFAPILFPPLASLFGASVHVRLFGTSFLLRLCLVAAAAAYALFFLGVVAASFRRSASRERRRGVLIMLAVAAVFCGLTGVNIHAVMRNTLYGGHEWVGREVDMADYLPFMPGSRLAIPSVAPSLRIAARHPRVGGDIAWLPAYGAAAQAVYVPEGDGRSVGEDRREAESGAAEEDEAFSEPDVGMEIARAALRDAVTCCEPVAALALLAAGDIDVFFGTPPSGEQLQGLRDQGLTPVVTPIAREALVFFVHRENPVTGLSLTLLRDIYAGKADQWKEAGGADAGILAFQNPEGSASRRVMEALVMRGQPAVVPLREEYVADGLGNIVNQVAEYRNWPNALGYAFRWKASRQFPSGEIRFLSVDGVSPTPETIRNGEYPLAVPVVMVTCRPPSAEARDLQAWILGPEGQALLAKAGYTPITCME